MGVTAFVANDACFNVETQVRRSSFRPGCAVIS